MPFDDRQSGRIEIEQAIGLRTDPCIQVLLVQLERRTLVDLGQGERQQIGEVGRVVEQAAGLGHPLVQVLAHEGKAADAGRITRAVVTDRTGISPVHRSRVVIVLFGRDADRHVQHVLQRDTMPGGHSGQFGHVRADRIGHAQAPLRLGDPDHHAGQGLADRMHDVRVVRADAIAIALVTHRPAMPDQQRVIEQAPIQESGHIDGAVEQRIVHGKAGEVQGRPDRQRPGRPGGMPPGGRHALFRADLTARQESSAVPGEVAVPQRLGGFGEWRHRGSKGSGGAEPAVRPPPPANLTPAPARYRRRWPAGRSPPSSPRRAGDGPSRPRCSRPARRCRPRSATAPAGRTGKR